MTDSRQQILDELGKVAFAEVQSPVRASDKTAALDKLAKIAGLYRDADSNRDQRLVQVTQVTVILDRGNGVTETETQERKVVEGAGRVLESSEEEPS